MKKNILIIEDESAIANNIVYSLKTEGYISFWCATGMEGLETLKNKEIDLIVLDVGLPDVSGFELIKKIRKYSEVPVVFLTARSEEVDRIVGLELGADDYAVKPFSPRELTARIKAILRRSEKNDNENYNESENVFRIDPNKRQIKFFDENLNLSRYEYDILRLFLDRPGWVFSREKIMDLVWIEPGESFDRTVDAHIKTIRAKLKIVNPNFEAIETHRGIGYALRDKR